MAKAIDRLAFVQADPIRAPARAQDLILRHRVKDYRAGDLERRYASLAIEEDYLVNYGFLPRAHVALMHPRPHLGLVQPRTARSGWTARQRNRSAEIIEFIRERGEAHPDEVEAQFSGGRVKNAWGGSSRASTQLLDLMHYRGALRIARRDSGVRVYALPRFEPLELAPEERADRLLHLVISLYGPVPERGLGTLTSFLRVGAPTLKPALRAAMARLKTELPRETIDGVTWYWPADAKPMPNAPPHEQVRFLAPFDPLVWDRRRFELLWGWAYRFEAYTPVHKRVRGYYALPLLFRDEVLGWANVTEAGPSFGYLAGHAPKDRTFTRELDAEVTRLATFLREKDRTPETNDLR